jgi:hypothetical protein
VAYSTVDQLSALLETDREAFAEQLGTNHWFEDTLVRFVPLLQADPTLAAATRAHVASYRLDAFDTWMKRRILPLTTLDMARFCELADAVARERDPLFPGLRPDGLVYVDTWYCGGRQHHDARVDGRGWVLDAVDEDVGPGEAIHRAQWAADAHGDGWVIGVRLDWSSTTVHVWVEPRR